MRPGFPFNVSGRLYRYRHAGNVVLASGIVAGIIAHCCDFSPAWVAFFVGAFAVSVAIAVIEARVDRGRC